MTVLSCGNESGFERPSVTGKAGEVLVVMEKALWETSPGEKIRDVLLKEHLALPQPEPMFDPVNVPSAAFSKMLKTHRNIIITDLSDDIDSSKVIVRQNVWAQPQMVIKMSADSKEKLISMITRNRDKILAIFESAERKRLMARYKKYEDIEIDRLLRNKYNIELFVPKGYRIAMDSLGFVWLSHEPQLVEQGIFVYSYPYRDEKTFTLSYLLHKRDSVLKRMVKGEKHGSHMGTEHEMPVHVKELAIMDDHYAVELRGLWKLINDCCMGGPFMSITTLDEKRNRIITVEGFVYSPKFDKRNYLRQVEAILYSLKLVDDNEDEDN